jgi:hypothetical protein
VGGGESKPVELQIVHLDKEKAADRYLDEICNEAVNRIYLGVSAGPSEIFVCTGSIPVAPSSLPR